MNFCLGVRKTLTNTGPGFTNCGETRESECRNGVWHGKATIISHKKVFLGFSRGLVDRSTVQNTISENGSVKLAKNIDKHSDDAFYRNCKALGALIAIEELDGGIEY